MPDGCFVILLESESEFKVLGYYLEENVSKFEITSELFLRLNLDHEKNEYNSLNLKDLILISYIHKFKGKVARKAVGIIIGLILNETDNPEKFRPALKKAAEAIDSPDILEITEGVFKEKLKEIYQTHLETLYGLLDAEALKESIIAKTKELLSGSKKERKQVDDVLKKIELGLHEKISDHYRTANDAISTEDYKVAAKNLEAAADLADQLLENELAKELREKAKTTGVIKTSEKSIDDKIQEARSYMKKEQFNLASIAYKSASEKAKELMLPDKEEEYRLKSKALFDFYQADQKYKKK